MNLKNELSEIKGIVKGKNETIAELENVREKQLKEIAALEYKLENSIKMASDTSFMRERYEESERKLEKLRKEKVFFFKITQY